MNDGSEMALRVPVKALRPSEYTSALIQALRSEPERVRGKEVLEIGSGSGVVLAVLGALGAGSVCGIDIEADAIEASSRLLARLGHDNAEFLHGDMLLVLGALIQPYLVPAPLPAAFVTWFFVLNIGAVTSIIFGLLYYFVGQRNFFQERSESLLLNILPQSIADKLKADTQTIADQFSSASILFADVVDFTPVTEHLPPAEVVSMLSTMPS